MTTTYGRNRESIGDIEEQLHSIFAQNAHVYYNDGSDTPVVPADQLVDIIPAFSEAYGVQLMSEEEWADLNRLLAENPGLGVTPQILTQLIAERAPKKSDSPERPAVPSRPPSRGPPQTPVSTKGPSPFDRRQRSTPLGGEVHPPSSWAKRPPPARRKSDAGSRSDSESSYTSPPNAYGRSRAPSNPTSPSTVHASLASPTFPYRTPSRPPSRQSHSIIGSPELIDEATIMQPLSLFGSDSDPESDEEVHLGLIPDRGAGASTISLLEQADQETLQRENTDLKKKLLEAESTLQKRLIEHDNELEELQGKLDEMRSELNAAKREEKELRSKERQNMAQIAILESEIAKVSDALKNAKDTYSSLQRQYQEQCSASEKYRDDLRKRDETIRSLRDAVGLHEHEASKWAREQQHYEDRIAQLDAELALANQLQAELDAQKQENLTLKETIDRLHFELDEQRNATIQGANVGGGANSIPGTLSKSLGAELAKNGWGEEEDVQVSQEVDTNERDVSFELDREESEEEDFIETIVTRRRKVPARANKNELHSFVEEKEYADAYTQYESSEFTTSSTTQTDPEPIVLTASSSIQTEELPTQTFAIQTEPEPVPVPKVTFDIDIQTDDLDSSDFPESTTSEPEEAIASTSSSSSTSTATPSTPKAKAKELDELPLGDQPPTYNQVQEQEWRVREVLRKWHPGLSDAEDINLPSAVSDEAVEEWKTLKEELGIDCLVIDKLLASAERTASPRASQTPPEGKPIRRGRFYNIYNTYIYPKTQSSSLSTLFTMFGVSAIAFFAGAYMNSYPLYVNPGHVGVYDRAMWKAFNSMSPAGEGFVLPSDGTSAVWNILGRVGGGAARIARGWPT